MKLAVDTHILSNRFNDFKAIEMIKEAGFDAVDFSLFSRSDLDTVLGENFRIYAEKIRDHIKSNGLYCRQAHAPFNISYVVDKLDESEPKFLKLIRSIEFASIIGAESIVIHPRFNYGFPETDPIEYNINFFKLLVPYAEKFGIYLACENVFAPDLKRKCSVPSVSGTPEMMKHLINEIGSPRVVACVDVGHSSIVGVEPEDFISGIPGDILKAIHIHDNDYLIDKHTLPFMCELNWDNIMSSLKKIDYKGDLNLEISSYLEKFPDELIMDALKYAKKVGRYLISVFENN